jgi:hypothetical protein
MPWILRCFLGPFFFHYSCISLSFFLSFVFMAPDLNPELEKSDTPTLCDQF